VDSEARTVVGRWEVLSFQLVVTSEDTESSEEWGLVSIGEIIF